MKRIVAFCLVVLCMLGNGSPVFAVDTFNLKMKTGHWIEFANQPLPDDGVFLLDEGHIDKFEKLDMYGKSGQIYGMPANFFGDPNVLAENGLKLKVEPDGNLFFTNSEETIQFKPVSDLDGMFQLEYISPKPEGREELVYLTASDSFIHLVKFVKEGNKEYITLNSFTEDYNAMELTTSTSNEDEEKAEEVDLTEPPSSEELALLQELTEFKDWHLFGNLILSVDTENVSEENVAYQSIVNFLDTEIDEEFITLFEEYFKGEEAKELFTSFFVTGDQNKEAYIIGANEENGFYDKVEDKEIRSLLVPTRTEYEDVFVLDADGNRWVYFKKDKELYVIGNESENEVFVYQLLLEDDERFSEEFLAEYTAASEEVVEEPKPEPKKEEKTYSPPVNKQETKPANDAPSEFYNNDNISENIYPAIVTVVKQAVEQNEGITNAKFPWGYEDYNINSLGGDMYNTTGQFSHNGYTYAFEMIIFMKPDTSGRVEFYNVY